MTRINDSIMEEALLEVGNEKSDIDQVVKISSGTTQQIKKAKIDKEELDKPIGVYLSKEEKDDFQMFCSFNKKSATSVARELIAKYLKKNKDMVDKLKALEKLK
jgi:hypothetical protein